MEASDQQLEQHQVDQRQEQACSFEIVKLVLGFGWGCYCFVDFFL